jgi:hypothetical protein
MLAQELEKIERYREAASYRVSLARHSKELVRRAEMLCAESGEERSRLLGGLVKCGIEKLHLTKGMIKMENKQRRKFERRQVETSVRRNKFRELEKQLYKEGLEEQLQPESQ